MNEELRIIIKAVTDEAKRNLDEVRKELERVGSTASESGKKVDKAMSAMGKATAAAVGSVVALTTALVTLGKSSIQFQKTQAQLIAGFRSAGLTASDALKVYKDLYGFLGEADTATETANLLAQLTQDTTKLTEWTKILQGVYAKFPDSLPIETLAESINHTAKLGKVQGSLTDALEWTGVNLESFNAALAQTRSVEEREVLIRSTLNNLYMGASKAYGQANQALIQYHRSQVEVDRALASAMNYVTPLLTYLNHLAATLLTYLKPAFEVVASVIIIFVQWIIAAIKAVGAFFGMFGAGEGDKVADSMGEAADNTNNFASGMENVNQALGGAVQQAKELRRQTMGFDELNVLASQSSSSISTPGIGGSGGGAINIPEIAIPDLETGLNLPDMKAFEEKVAKVKEYLKVILNLIGLIGAALLIWKIGSIINDIMLLNMTLKEIQDKFGVTRKAAAKLMQGAEDRINVLKSLLIDIGGWFLIIAGAIALVWGFADAWVNGLDWQNFSLILGGIAAIVAGFALLFGSSAAAIALLVGGIIALIIGIKDLIENGYSMEAVLMVAAGAIAVVVGAVWAFNAALLANPITWIVVAIMALVAAFIVLWNECEGFRNFWIGLWEGIKKVFSAVWKWIKEAIASMGAALSSVGSFFSGLWKNIVSTFTQAGTAIANAVSGAFSSAVNWVLEKAINIINGFLGAINFATGIINKIPGVNIKTLSLLSVPKLATGGITTGATMAMIGERGKEAVLPLENNTGWMDVLAERIAAKNGAPTRIALVLDGKELGHATIKSINNITKQTGSLQLALV